MGGRQTPPLLSTLPYLPTKRPASDTATSQPVTPNEQGERAWQGRKAGAPVDYLTTAPSVSTSAASWRSRVSGSGEGQPATIRIEGGQTRERRRRRGPRRRCLRPLLCCAVASSCDNLQVIKSEPLKVRGGKMRRRRDGKLLSR